MPTLTQPLVGRMIVDAVRNRLAVRSTGEVVNPDLLGLSERLPLLAAVRELPDQLLLLRVDRNDRLSGSLVSFDLGRDVLELSVPVGMSSTFTALLRLLKAIPQVVKHPAGGLGTDLEALLPEGFREMRRALRRPPEGRLRMTPRRWVQQRFQRLPQARLGLPQGLAACSLPPDPRPPLSRRWSPFLGLELRHAGSHCRSREARRLGDGRHTAPPETSRLSARPEAHLPLVQVALEKLEALANGVPLDHGDRRSRSGSRRNFQGFREAQLTRLFCAASLVATRSL